MKKFIAGIIIFLLGILSTLFYFRISVWPDQLQLLQYMCENNPSLLYTGDWVLRIAFPAFFLLGASVILFIVFALKSRRDTSHTIDEEVKDNEKNENI